MSKYPGLYYYLCSLTDPQITVLGVREDREIDEKVIRRSNQRFYYDMGKSKLKVREFILANLEFRDFQFIL